MPSYDLVNIKPVKLDTRLLVGCIRFVFQRQRLAAPDATLWQQGLLSITIKSAQTIVPKPPDGPGQDKFQGHVGCKPYRMTALGP